MTKNALPIDTRSWYRIFRAPLQIGLLSTVGLVGALVGDAEWDALSWLALAAPLWVTCRKLVVAVRSAGEAPAAMSALSSSSSDRNQPRNG